MKIFGGQIWPFHQLEYYEPRTTVEDLFASSEVITGMSLSLINFVTEAGPDDDH